MMLGQLPKQQDILSHACSVRCRPYAIRVYHTPDAFLAILPIRCPVSCATGQMPICLCQTTHAYSVVFNDRLASKAAAHISTGSLRQPASIASADAGFSPQLHVGQILSRCRLLPSAAFNLGQISSQKQAPALSCMLGRCRSCLDASPFAP